MKITYYLEVISSWCYWAEPAWADLKRRYAGRVETGNPGITDPLMGGMAVRS